MIKTDNFCRYSYVNCIFKLFLLALQPESSSRLNQLLAFLPNERTKCIDIPLVDDDTALEDIQTLTFTLSVPPESDVALGDIQVVTVLILDDDGL